MNGSGKSIASSGDIGQDIPGFDAETGKKHWLEDPMWQPTRLLIETIGGATDYMEQYFAINIVFEPLVGELFRSGFVMQAAASQNDFMTPTVVSSAEGDYQRNLANTVELVHMLVSDPAHSAHNTALFNSWLEKYGDLAVKAAKNLQPIWSMPHHKMVQFSDAFASAVSRMQNIATQVPGRDPRRGRDPWPPAHLRGCAPGPRPAEHEDRRGDEPGVHARRDRQGRRRLPWRPELRAPRGP